jgi:CheY-like chemotaxis protein
MTRLLARILETTPPPHQSDLTNQRASRARSHNPRPRSRPPTNPGRHAPEGLLAHDETAAVKMAAMLPTNAVGTAFATQCVAARAQIGNVLQPRREHDGDDLRIVIGLNAQYIALTETSRAAPAMRRMLRIGLTPDGYAISESDRGTGALEAVRRRDTDLILLDLGLPDVDGLEITRAASSFSRNGSSKQSSAPLSSTWVGINVPPSRINAMIGAVHRARTRCITSVPGTSSSSVDRMARSGGVRRIRSSASRPVSAVTTA